MHEVVLFIHSTGTSPHMWSDISPAVTGGRENVFPANLGYPPNPPIERGQSVTIVDECTHLLGILGDKPERVHIVAHSYGASVALAMAELPSFQNRLGSMVLFEPVLFGALIADHGGEIAATEPATIASAREFASNPVFADPAKGGGPEWLETFIDYWNRPGSWLRMPDSMKQQTLALGWKMCLEVQSCFRTDKPFRDYAIGHPTTLVIGARTTVHSRAMTHALARVHGLTVKELAGTGHMAPLTHPALVHATIAEHFAALPPIA